MEGQAVKTFQVGQVVYEVFNHQRLNVSKEQPHYTSAKVKLVGRKWVTLASGHRIKIDAVTPCVAERQDFGETPMIYATREAARDSVERHKLTKRIQDPAFQVARFDHVVKTKNTPARLRHILATLEAALSGGEFPVFTGEPTADTVEVE